MNKEDVFNNAIAIFGGPNQTDYVENADTDESDQAVWCRIAFPQALDFCAVEVGSKEFRKYYLLDTVTGDTVASADWEYVYSKPADFLQLVRLTDDGDLTKTYEHDERGGYIFTNDEDPYLDYIAKPDRDNTSSYSPGFANVVSARMAVMICGIWKKELIGYAAQRYSAALSEAHAQNNKSNYVEATSWWDANL